MEKQKSQRTDNRKLDSSSGGRINKVKGKGLREREMLDH